MRTGSQILGLGLLVLAACETTDDPTALGEPIVVEQGTFKHGALPGVALAAGGTPSAPVLTSFAPGFGILRPGTRGATITGRSTGDAYSVGLRFADQGSGYWVQPVGSEDRLIPGELNWSMAFDAATDIEPGKHALELVSFDKDGKPGTKQALDLCIASELPDNLNVCDPKNKPPLAIASLRWNADSDLDLTIVAPDGTTFGRSKRSLLNGTTVVAKLDGDGVSGCLADGRRMENFSFIENPPAGTWHVYANLFDACAKPAVQFELKLYQRQENGDGTYALIETSTVDGQFVRAQANGGAGTPLFLTDIQFQ
jgi:hypothetical protein